MLQAPEELYHEDNGGPGGDIGRGSKMSKANSAGRSKPVIILGMNVQSTSEATITTGVTLTPAQKVSSTRKVRSANKRHVTWRLYVHQVEPRTTTGKNTRLNGITLAGCPIHPTSTQTYAGA